MSEEEFKTKPTSEILKILDKLILKPIDPQYVWPILKNAVTRAVFISEYTFFGKDKNNSLYQSFILSNLETKEVGLYSDILALSCYITFIDKDILNSIKVRLPGKYNYLTKLGALDYLLNFKDKINREEYIRLNESVLTNTKNTLVKIQTLINLLAFQNSDRHLSKLFQELKKGIAPTLFYRVLNNLLDYSIIGINNNAIIEIISIIELKNFDKRVKDEITDGIRSCLH